MDQGAQAFVLPPFTADILQTEKSFAAEIDRMTACDFDGALALCRSLLEENRSVLVGDRARSAAYARCLTRFLLHKKSKNRLVPLLESDRELRALLFGELNTYKYSLTFLMKRLVRLNRLDLTREILSLLWDNPFRDDTAPAYSDRWSFRFLVSDTLRAPADYLSLTPESLALLGEWLDKQ